MIELLVEGKLPILAEGQLDLPKQPPFDVLTPGWAVKATVQLGEGDPNLVRLFDAWYLKEWGLDVRAGDGRGAWVRATMQCVAMNRECGLQVTRAWSEPLRRTGGQLYRPSPRFQPIKRWTWTYELAAARYAWTAAPEAFTCRRLALEAAN